MITVKTAKYNIKIYRQREGYYRKAAIDCIRKGRYPESLEFIGKAMRQEAQADATAALLDQAKSA